MEDPRHLEETTPGNAKHWIFTKNNPERPFPTLETIGRDCSYLVYQLEVGANGTPHLQGFVSFASKIRAHPLSLLLPHTWFKPARGTPQQCYEYCSKPDTRQEGPFEFGARPGPKGKRNDLERLRLAIRPEPGNNLAIIADPELFPSYLRYHSAIDKVRGFLAQPNPDPPFICVLLGTSGAGKSEFVKQFCRPYFRFSSQDGWWDCYDGQDTVFFDDWDGSSMQYRLLLQVLNSDVPRVKVKQGFVQPFLREIYITTNVHPINWYKPSVTTHYVWDLSHPLCRRLKQYGEMRVVPPWTADRVWPPLCPSVDLMDPSYYHYGRRDEEEPPRRRLRMIGEGMPEDLFGRNLARE